MDGTRAVRRIPWRAVGTSLALLALQGTIARAQTLPSIVYPSGSSADSSYGHGTLASSRPARDGTYVFDTAVNGSPVPMIFDTGASVVVLRAEDVGRLGIDSAALDYSRAVQTANGRADVAPVTIATLTVGGITRHDVPAVVGRPGALHANLLGQTFLRRLTGFKREGDRIILESE